MRILAHISQALVCLLLGLALGPPGCVAEGSHTVSSPGIAICELNSYDVHHLDAPPRQIATLGGGALVHFAWASQDAIVPDSLVFRHRTVYYDVFSSSTGFLIGGCGVTVGWIYGKAQSSSAASGGQFPEPAWGQYASIDIGLDDRAHVTFQHNTPGCYEPDCPIGSWEHIQLAPGDVTFDGYVLPSSQEEQAVEPHLTVDRNPAKAESGVDVFHVVSRYSDASSVPLNPMFYWRRIGVAGAWDGPAILDVEHGHNHHVTSDVTSDKLAVIYLRNDLEPNALNQIMYMESSDNGADWLAAGVPAYPTPLTDLGFAPAQVTNYTDSAGPQSWLECTGEYDLDGMLHVIWVEQVVAGIGFDCRLRHWDDVTLTTRTIAVAIGWGNTGLPGVRDLWLAYPQFSFGDGSTSCTDGPNNPGGGGATSNRNYIYLTYEQYGGPTPTQAQDVSAQGYQNLDLFMTVSNDRGVSWSAPSNLTNTHTPGCDGTQAGNECASEKDPSIAEVVDDTIHLMYFLDTDAGDAVFGQGSWTFGPVMYYRIPGGTDAQYLCPEIAPRIQESLTVTDSVCGDIARLNPPGIATEELTIENLGNAVLSGDVSVAPPSATWLQLSTGGFSILPGGAANVRNVVMDAEDASITGTGLYEAQIEITHDDPAVPSPVVIPVSFLVHDHEAPEAAFSGSYTPSLPPVTVEFSSAGSVGAESYYWDFGDGDTSAEVNPVHTYTQSGLYDVLLRVSQDLGVCVRSDSLVQYGVVDVFACSCPHQCDFDDDGFLTSLDMSSLIDILFAGMPDMQDPACPLTRADFDADGFPTSLDLSRLIDYLFAGGDGSVDPCI